MKKLIVLRHGKSDWTEEDEDDFDRKLTKSGEKRSAEMGFFIKSKAEKPDYIFSSDAIRAKMTAEIIAENIEYDINNIGFEYKLYLASVSTILKLIGKIENSIDFIVLVGHNPGLTDLINYLGVRLDNLPTASACCFHFQTNDWQSIDKQNGQFQWIQFAKNLS